MLRRRRELEKKILSINTGEREKAAGMKRVKDRWRQRKEIHKLKRSYAILRNRARVAAFKRVADGKTVEDLGEPLWKVSTLHTKVSERKERQDSKKGKGEAEGESKGPFRSYEGGVSGLDE